MISLHMVTSCACACLILLGTSCAAGAEQYDYSNTANRNLLAMTSTMKAVRENAAANYQSMNFETALSEYKQICASVSACYGDFYWLGETHFQLGQFSDAASAFERSIAMFPSGSDRARVRLVEACMEARQFDRAKDSCRSALQNVTDQYSLLVLNQMQKALEAICAKGMFVPEKSASRHKVEK